MQLSDRRSHERLTADDVKACWLLGDYSASGYLFHLIRALRKDGWWLRINNVSQFCRDWEISRKAFYAAKARLVLDGRIQEKEESLDLRVVSDGNSCYPEGAVQPNGNSSCYPEGAVQPNGNNLSPFGDTDLLETFTQLEFQESPRSLSDLSHLERSSPSQTHPPHPAREKELLKFVASRNPEARNKRAYAIVCLKQDREFWEKEYEEYLKALERISVPLPPQAPNFERFEDEPVEQRFSRYQSMWSTPQCRNGIKQAIAAHPEWGMRVGATGPEWVTTAGGV